MPKTLYLPLKKKWFNMIKDGIKKEEYREIKPKYLALFCDFVHEASEPNKYNEFDVGFHLMWPMDFSEKYDTLVFTLGYPKANDPERRLEFNNPKIRIGEGKPEWGAEPGKKYFVITWDE